jgi:hypothetical protein
VTNPEIVKEPTPNGGDYSEFWYLTKDGNAAKNMAEATQFRILEKTNDGRLIQTTYGELKK